LTGYTDFISWLDLDDLSSEKWKNKSTTIVADFRFKAFGKPFSCAWDGKGQVDYILDDAIVDENKVELWLASTLYSPAEYQLISDLLVTNGQSSDAKKIGYAAKLIDTRQDFEDGAWSAFAADLASRLSIGYGYYPIFAFLWAVVFCAFGAYVFCGATEEQIIVSGGTVEPVATSGWRKCVWGPTLFHAIKYREDDKGIHKQDFGVINPIGYSFDTLLPIIRLREIHYQVELEGWRHYYFYFQRIVGWGLGIFVLGALSGLTK
jgi:hypothetical protein